MEITKYLNEIDKKVSNLKRLTGCKLYCFRGEDQLFEFHSQPNLFRGKIFDAYNNKRCIEKNILDELKANNLSVNHNLLEIAMDAQHGGFPSRLLDVSFNSLIALFFAVTPHYTKPLDANDEKDGRVIIYAIDEMATSKSKSINDIYREIVEEGKFSSRFDGYFHYLIDFSDLNARIKAQQGGFILFGGNQYVPIPPGRYLEIKIKPESKKIIREELELYFGINMGTIYPEAYNKVSYITSKSEIVSCGINYYENIKKEIENCLDYYIISLNCEQDQRKRKDLKKEIKSFIIAISLSITNFLSSDYELLSESSKSDTLKLEVDEINDLITKFVKTVNEKLDVEFINPQLLQKEGESNEYKLKG